MRPKGVVISDRNKLWGNTVVKKKHQTKLLPLSHISTTLKTYDRGEISKRKPLRSQNINVSLIVDSAHVQKPFKKSSHHSASFLNEVLSSSSVTHKGSNTATHSKINVILQDSHFQQRHPEEKVPSEDYRQMQPSIHTILPSNPPSESLVGGLRKALYDLRTLIKVFENSCEGGKFDILLSINVLKQLSKSETLVIPDLRFSVNGGDGKVYILHHPNSQPFQQFTKRNVSSVRIAINSELTFKLGNNAIWIPYWKIAQI